MNDNIISWTAYRLAHQHGHMWALPKPDRYTRDRRLQKDLLIKACDEFENDFPPGIYPSNSHITGTGRLEWNIDPRNHNQHDQVMLTVIRPQTCVGGLNPYCQLGPYSGQFATSRGGIIVLRCNLIVDALTGLALPDDIDPHRNLSSSPLAEQRHWLTMFQALQVIGIGELGDQSGPDILWDTCVRGLYKELSSDSAVPLVEELPANWLTSSLDITDLQ
jgi:hypothetical protein